MMERVGKPPLILVTGQPGAGKSTLARQLAVELRLPLLAKDTIKESLAEALATDPVSITESRDLGDAAFEVVFGLLAEGFPAIAEASWSPSDARPRLLALPHLLVELHCSCPPAVARQRYVDRAPTRHWVHRDADRFDDEHLWSGTRAIGLDGAVVFDINTERPVDTDELLGRLLRVPELRASGDAI